jgi:GT2 family glycosyltransferase
MSERERRASGPVKEPRGEPVPADEPASVLAPKGLVSVLIPCIGQLEYTRLCVPGVVRGSRSPFELIFVDAGSLDGTAEYLAGVQAVAPVRVEVVRAATDLGLPSAAREAAARARGEYVVLLNNDCVVPPGWLGQLVALAESSAGVGLVGAMSNYAAGPQRVAKVPYRVGPRPGGGGEGARVDVGAVLRFAEEFREKSKGKCFETDRLGGFCLLVKREVLKRVGPLESESGLGLFDTDLLCRKAQEAGYALACCADLFVHHFGTHTFAHGAPAGQTKP